MRKQFYFSHLLERLVSSLMLTHVSFLLLTVQDTTFAARQPEFESHLPYSFINIGPS